MTILDIPADVIIVIMHYLSIRELAFLSRSCRYLHTIVEEFGWRVYLNLHPLSTKSYSTSAPSWCARTHVRVNSYVDEQWDRSLFVARPLSDRWEGKLQPILAINASRLLIAAGNLIYSYGFRTSSNVPDDAPGVFLEAIYSTSDTTHPKSDITSLTCLPDGVNDGQVFVGYANGTVEKISLPSMKGNKGTPYVLPLDREVYDSHGGDNIVESLSVTSTHMLSFSTSGAASLHSFASSSPVEKINVNARGWSSLLSTRSSHRFAAFGTSSALNPLLTYDILPTGISPVPSYLLPTELTHSSAVYDITSAPMSSPWGASDQILISGWYDGYVRVHDLRASNTARTITRTNEDTSSSTSISAFEPTLSFSDPWSFEPIYSVSSGGGSGAHIAAGSARHSVIAFWDVRYSKGWSVHAPGNDPSPVYSVVLDGARVFGANQSRGFVLDFGPGVKEGTYPEVEVNSQTGPRQRVRRDLNTLTRAPIGAGFYVTKYSHARSKWTGKSL
ncbi:hypothetical protein BXZ70DRAFT_1048542 [Cristinia sonorae]|uniref:F-box domain-containing protein n=1 Tax=Cristinia sonorae TaxID=1940300 RepID=A0A8K0UVH8_9AGAR|nr:hypothetical protein BXZ70DRAFT_1048542 [Cristinia sonorae]